MTRKLFLIAVAVFAAIAGIVFFEVELQRFAAVRAIDGALIEHFFVELDGIAALRAGDFVIAFVFVVFPCVVIVIVFVLVDVVELFFQLAEVFVNLVYLAAGSSYASSISSTERERSSSRSTIALKSFVSFAFGSRSMPSIKPRMYAAFSEFVMLAPIFPAGKRAA